jgi:alkanesulfonate monooxygenase SsuD/methylene tetrahydromethanopterin reductase-like flavin-dependent oxidoreductase (luciferase family)
MKFGMNIRNWGPTATPDFLSACARSADHSTLDSIWLNDHLGLPPQFDNEYGIDADMGDILDPLAVANFLAGITTRIRFGTGVLVLPYRPAVLTSKLIASIQILSNNRFLLGCGPGYLAEEFIALGVSKGKRGKITDETLEFLHEASKKTLHDLNGQDFLVKPQLSLPPIYVGGIAQIAIPRAIKYGIGWQPAFGQTPDDIVSTMKEWNSKTDDAGLKRLEVIMMKTLPLGEKNKAVDLAAAYKEAGVTEFVHTQGYETPYQYKEIIEQVDGAIRQAIH